MSSFSTVYQLMFGGGGVISLFVEFTSRENVTPSADGGVEEVCHVAWNVYVNISAECFITVIPLTFCFL